jgi:hypothetical protein
MSTKNSENSENQYICKKCDYLCHKKQHFLQHCKTMKHKINNVENSEEPKLINYVCICGKTYKERTGLWRHQKNCKNVKSNDIIQNQNQINIDSSILSELLKQNNEFKELLIEQQKQLLDKSNIISYTTNNIVNGNINNNNHFNLQLFLNETCKDAMTIDDFIKSLKPTIHDLEETGRLGYSAGITRIIVNGLKELDVSKRPIHCSDLKRETMFVKNTDKWEKEEDNKPNLIKAIKEIGKKNISNIFEWQKDHINFNHYDSKQNDQYLQIVTNSMSGGTEQEQQTNYEKIIKNIAKETLIDKNKK